MTGETNGVGEGCNRLIRAIGWISLVAAAICLAALTLIFTATILFRAFGHSISASDDIASILLGATFTLGFAYVMSLDDHLSVDILTGRMSGPAGTLLRFVLLAVTILVMGFVAFGLWNMLATAIRNNLTMPSALPIPRALPIGAVFAGVVMFEITLVLRLIERLAAGTYPQPLRGLKEDEA